MPIEEASPCSSQSPVKVPTGQQTKPKHCLTETSFQAGNQRPGLNLSLSLSLSFSPTPPLSKHNFCVVLVFVFDQMWAG